ncbi:hypothetical protein ACGFIY_21025 [Micromonospora chersina]|uniref:hypothetical protein n=1 Tax=Micromonospora chersina TaxID=47854 RepID=UPI00371A3871
MSALLRALARRIRLLLHRHDPIECWCELTAADAPAQILPVNAGPDQCGECWVLPGKTHELSCPEVSLEQMQAYLDSVGGAR